MDAAYKGPYFSSRGTEVRLGKRLGGGGEGDVFDLSPAGSMVAKIYHKPLDPEKQEKLRVMVRGCNAELQGISAWPTELLCAGKGGPVCGFTMPKVPDCEPVHKVYGPSHRKQSFPDADWKFLVRAAKNLAAAFYVIHKYGYVVGDVNEGNILVSSAACVRLIDCDSFQVRTPDHVYCCEVGVPQFTPPEIQSRNDFRLQRSMNHDNFGLAVLVFHLLFMGRHPYSGVYRGPGDMPLEKAIAEHRFAFGKNAARKSIAPPPDSVGLSIIPLAVAELFEDAFDEESARTGTRPDALDWWNALDSLERQLRVCRSDSIHKYYTGLSACPWCALEDRTGILLFLSSDSITKLDISREWNAVQSFESPGPLPRISPGDYRPVPAPLPAPLARAKTFSTLRRTAALVIAIGVAIAVLGIFSINPDFGTGIMEAAPSLLAAAGIAAVLWFFPGREAAERKRRIQARDAARYRWKLWEKKWQSDAGDVAFAAQLKKLEDARRRYEAIEKEYQRALASLKSSGRERQLQRFLGSQFLDSCTIPQIGPNQKTLLRSFGIETAADLTRQRLSSIPQLGSMTADILLAWRKKLEREFVYDASSGVDRLDIQALVHSYQPKMKPVEHELQNGIESLYQIRETTLRNRIRLKTAVQQGAMTLAQAEADASVFDTPLSFLGI